jgi:hypothetical protein
MFCGLAATISGFCLIISAWFSHSWKAQQEANGRLRDIVYGPWFCIGLRLIGSCIAILNALWIVVMSILQLTNLYNNCWCQASAFQNGTVNSWVAVLMTNSQVVTFASKYWIAGLFLSICSSFLIFPYIVIGKGDDIYNGNAE